MNNHIPESRPFEQGQKSNEPRSDGEHLWQSIGNVARRLAEKSEFLPMSESLIDYDDEFGGDA